MADKPSNDSSRSRDQKQAFNAGTPAFTTRGPKIEQLITTVLDPASAKAPPDKPARPSANAGGGMRATKPAPEKSPESTAPDASAAAQAAAMPAAPAPAPAPASDAGTHAETDLESLVTTVLDSAAAANRSAEVSATSTEGMQRAVASLANLISRLRTTALIIPGVAAVLLLIGTGVLAWSSLQLIDLLEKADQTLLAVGKRVVDMNAGLDNLQLIETHFSKALAERAASAAEDAAQATARDALQSKLEIGLADLGKTCAAPRVDKPSKQTDARHQALLAQIRSLETQTQSQERAIANMSTQLNSARAELPKAAGAPRRVEPAPDNEKDKPRTTAPPKAAATRERGKTPETGGGEFIRYPDPNNSAKSRPATPAVER